jgi:hypothetical protein
MKNQNQTKTAAAAIAIRLFRWCGGCVSPAGLDLKAAFARGARGGLRDHARV